METFSEKNLAGSLNFALPGDALAEGECLAVTNWRPEQRGILRSRLREDLIALSGSGAAAFNVIVSIFTTGNPQQIFVADRTAVYTISPTALLVTNPTSARVWFVNFQGYTWLMNEGIQKRTPDGINVFPWMIAAPTTAMGCSAGGSGGNLNGNYLYACSFVTADGIESNLSPVTTIGATNQVVNLSSIPVSTDASVVAVWIYRSGGTQSASNPLRVQVVSNGTTTSSDNMSDAQATLIDIEHTQDHDPPPPADGLVGPDNYGHLYAWKGSRLYWSKSDTPWYWPGEQYETGNYTDVGQDDEPIMCVTIKPRMILIYKLFSVWRIIGDVDTQYAVQEPIAVDRGLQCSNAICSDGVMDYLASDDGFYSCDGDRLSPITRALDNFWEDVAFPTTPPLDNFLPVANTPTGYFRQKQSWMARHFQNIYFTYTDQATATAAYPTLPLNSVTMVYNIETKRLSMDDRGWTAMFAATPPQGEDVFYAGSPQGHLHNMLGESTFALNLDYCSRYYDFGKPRNQKTFVDFEFEYFIQDPAGQLVVTVWFNNGKSFQTIGVLTGPGAATPQRVSKQLTVAIDTQAYNFAIQLQGYSALTTVVYGWHVRYRTEQRDANMYDSDVSDLGSPGLWKQVEAFAVDIEQTGTSTWTLYSDNSGTMSAVDSGTIASTGGSRATLRIPLSINSGSSAALNNGCLEGRLFRLVVTSPTSFRIYAAQFLARVIGTYIVNGDTLALLPQNFGSTRMKMYKRIDIDCEGGPYTLNVLTDLPGSALTQRASFAPASHLRQVDKLYLPNNTRGVFLQPALLAQGNLKIYSAKVWYKPIGEAGSSSWQWAELPLLPTQETFSWFSLQVDS